MQIDKLVQLLESPIFIPLRLHLLDVNSVSHNNLLKSLYGLLMMLPQSQAYKTLSDRLLTVSSLKMHLTVYNNQHNNINHFIENIGNNNISNNSSNNNNSTDNEWIKSNQINYNLLLNHFEEVQNKHSDYKLKVFHQLSKTTSTTANTNNSTSTTITINNNNNNNNNRPLSPTVSNTLPRIQSSEQIKSFSTTDSSEK